MPKLFPIKLQIEELMVGSVLKALHVMPGIARIDLDLGDAPSHKPVTGNAQEIIMAMLMKGPVLRADLAAAVGGSQTRLYTAISTLRKKHLIKNNGKMFSLSDKAAREFGPQQPAPLALPAPRKQKGKRTPRGVARNALILILTQTPGLRTGQIRESLGRNGTSPKSISGLIDRAKKETIIKKVGDGWQLTAKGQKLIPTTESANG
jgi:chromosome segregation and condensation protein ScpB